VAPLGGRVNKACGPPPACALLIHWLTAPCVTPKASAIRFWVQPSCWYNSKARNRRPSRQSEAPAVRVDRVDPFDNCSFIPPILSDISRQWPRV
jgi:hypothetical protein